MRCMDECCIQILSMMYHRNTQTRALMFRFDHIRSMNTLNGKIFDKWLYVLL